MNYGFIYETTNLINGKKYIGKHKRTQNLEDPDDLWYLGSGNLISKAIREYGVENFSRCILCECNNDEELNLMEEYYINSCNAVTNSNYYNMVPGGTGAREISEETRRKMSESHKGKHLSAEHKKKISLSMSKAVMGKKNHYYGKILSVNHRKKMSESHKGKSKSLIARINMSKASRTNIGFTRNYTLTCKICNVIFIENKPSYKYCKSCRNKSPMNQMSAPNMFGGDT